MKQDKYYTFIKNNNDYMKIQKKRPESIALSVKNFVNYSVGLKTNPLSSK